MRNPNAHLVSQPQIDDLDAALMLRYQAGDAGAFDQLYARHRQNLFAYLNRQIGQREHAEELFQEVWMNIINARETYTVQAQFRTWLYSIAHNKLMDYLRRYSRFEYTLFCRDEAAELALENVENSRVDQPDVQANAQQQGAAILHALQKLPAPQREAFLLYEDGGLSVEEIASAASISIEAAKSRLRYALNKLRKLLRDQL